MKNSTVVILVLGAVAFLYLSQNRTPIASFSERNQNPTGGATTGQPDTFNSILGLATSVFNTVGSLAKTQPSTT